MLKMQIEVQGCISTECDLKILLLLLLLLLTDVYVHARTLLSSLSVACNRSTNRRNHVTRATDSLNVPEVRLFINPSEVWRRGGGTSCLSSLGRNVTQGADICNEAG